MNKVYANHSLFADKKIAFAVIDQMNIKARHELLHKKMYDVTWFYTKRLAYTTGADCFYCDTIDDVMSRSDSYDIVIVQSIGNMITNNVFLEHVDSYVNSNPDFFLLAFTLDWQSEKGTDWIELHHQMIVVNVEQWKNIGSPKYGGWNNATAEMPNYTRSAENFHDKYTPYWIQGAPGTTQYSRVSQGHGFLKAALTNEMRIDNFSDEMRKCRLFLYPESEPAKFYESITSGEVIDPTMNPNQRRWIKSFSKPPQIWIYNSESYYFPREVIRDINTYIGPSAGFKYLDALKHNEQVEFVLYDYNERSVNWIKMLWKEWDGKNFNRFIKDKEEYKPYYKYINGDLATNQQILLDEFGGEEQFLELWNRFKASEVQFVVTNLYSTDSVKMLSEMSSETTLFYFSNIFATDLMIKIKSLDEIGDSYKDALDVFRQRGNVKLYGTNTLSEWIYERV
jgi:hypothetical protein